MDTDVVARRRSVLPFVVADAVALMVFVVAGIRSHHEVGALELFLRNAVPLEESTFKTALLTIMSPATLGVTVEETKLKPPPETSVAPV